MRQSEQHTQTAKFAVIVSMALATSLFSGCSMFGPRTSVPISNITNAAESGQSSTEILTAMKTARTTYALRGSDFAKLAERDVPEPVLDELQQRFFGDVDWLTRRWVTERLAGGRHGTDDERGTHYACGSATGCTGLGTGKTCVTIWPDNLRERHCQYDQARQFDATNRRDRTRFAHLPDLRRPRACRLTHAYGSTNRIDICQSRRTGRRA